MGLGPDLTASFFPLHLLKGPSPIKSHSKVLGLPIQHLNLEGGHTIQPITILNEYFLNECMN